MDTILWPQLCGNQSKEQATFWDYQESVNTSSPTVSQCFRDSVLVWTPCTLLWIISLLYVPYMLYSKTYFTWKQTSGINRFKSELILLFLLVEVSDLIFISGKYYEGRPVSLAAMVAPLVWIATLTLALFINITEFLKGIYTSGVQLMFWFSVVVSGLIAVWSDHTRYRTKDLQDDYDDTQEPLSKSWYFNYGISCCLFCLNFMADQKANPVNIEDKGFSNDTTSESSSERQKCGGEYIGRKNNISRESRATFLSKITHWYITDLVWTGFKRTLLFDDLENLPKEGRSEAMHETFEKEWTARVKACGYDLKKPFSENEHLPTPSMIMAMIKTIKKPLFLAAVFRFLDTAFALLTTYCLGLVITFIESPHTYTWQCFVLAFFLMIMKIINSLNCQLRCEYACNACRMLKAALGAMVYRKSLKLTPAARKTTTTGEIANLMSSDQDKCCWVFHEVYQLYMSPISAVFTFYWLYTLVGSSAFVGAGVIIILGIFNGPVLSHFYTKLEKRLTENNDKRIKILNEILSGIKVLKMYGWENSFQKKICDIRDTQLGIKTRQACISMCHTVTSDCQEYMVCFIVFASFVYMSPGDSLNPQKAFLTINLIGLLPWMLTHLPGYITFMTQAYVSMKRIRTMLLQQEIESTTMTFDPTSTTAITVKDGTFTWEDKTKPVLKNINMEIEKGNKVAIIGQVGAGKSSLLASLLGELTRVSGHVERQGTTAYVPQQAWIQNDTLRNNILFGKEFNQKKYNQIIDACALQQDLDVLPAGDNTEIGEKGINLSGGQKQRVSLARAVYQNEDIYLLDDPLSAVDAHVGKHIFKKVFSENGMLRNKTIVLVTHGMTFLHKMDHIITLKNGEICESGSYTELIKNNGNHFGAIFERQISETDRIPDENDNTETASRNEPEKQSNKSKIDDVLIEEEEAATGSATIASATSYAKSFGLWKILGIVLAYLSYSIFSSLTSVWVAKWSNDPVINGTQGFVQAKYRLQGYGLIVLGTLLSSLVSSFCILVGGVIASKNMHDKLLETILKAPTSFFDTTPLGRIVNRFSTDVNRLDSSLPHIIKWLISTLMHMIGTFYIILYNTPQVLFIIIPVGILFTATQRLYSKTLKQIHRIESIKRSPVFVNFDETLVGVGVIRAFNQQERFIQKHNILMDDVMTVGHCMRLTHRWLGLLLQSLGAVLVFFTSVFALSQKDVIGASLAALSVTVSISCADCMDGLIWSTSEVESQSVSIERIEEYSKVKSEAPKEIKEKKPESDWPSKGAVTFKNYSTRYREGLPLVIKDLSFEISPAEKVGIVGRTGAGKSSVTLSLFRIIEGASGSITIDGIDISDIGLHDLRSKLTIIPQDPVLFSGSLRQNLDPFSSYTDDQINDALSHAHLMTFVKTLDSGLDHECGENGDSLSVGQRQLVCLARALLRKSKVLILDEATAAVDLATDDLIQKTIRTEFKDCTVITIAHRLNTIMDYDRILVLECGQIKEWDTPENLLKDKESDFYSMAKHAGLK